MTDWIFRQGFKAAACRLTQPLFLSYSPARLLSKEIWAIFEDWSKMTALARPAQLPKSPSQEICTPRRKLLRNV
jgi:hypothetical protein